MSETILQKRVRESIGKNAIIYLHSGWKYEGKLTGADEHYIEILDLKLKAYKILEWDEIKDVTIQKIKAEDLGTGLANTSSEPFPDISEKKDSKRSDVNGTS